MVISRGRVIIPSGHHCLSAGRWAIGVSVPGHGRCTSAHGPRRSWPLGRGPSISNWRSSLQGRGASGGYPFKKGFSARGAPYPTGCSSGSTKTPRWATAAGVHGWGTPSARGLKLRFSGLFHFDWFAIKRLSIHFTSSILCICWTVESHESETP